MKVGSLNLFIKFRSAYLLLLKTNIISLTSYEPTVSKMKLILNDLNYQEWSIDFLVYLRTLGLQKQVKFDSFDAYFATIPISGLEQEYLNEIANARGENQNAIDLEKEKIKKDWTRERRKFIAEKDALLKKWREEDDETKGHIEKYIDKSFMKEIKDLESAYETWEKLKGMGVKNKGTQAYYTFSSFLDLKYNKQILLGDYVNQHQELIDKLEGTKCELSQYCAAMRLLHSRT